MSVQKISNTILGVGVDDTTIDLFESQYPVPTGVSYNSYVILDEKVAILSAPPPPAHLRPTPSARRSARSRTAIWMSACAAAANPPSPNSPWAVSAP